MILPITDRNNILNLIPQRDPIIMVDTLWEYTPSTGVIGLTIASNNLFVQQETFLESGLIEHIAQSIALHKGYSYYLSGKPAPMGYIGAIKKIEISALPKVGSALRTHLSIVQEFMDVTLVALQTFVGDTLIAQGEMKTVLAPTNS
ncbi:hypothetical protein [Capnocytophaga sp. oral taxon 878]|uniref:hypothetical protein n=1 Tax=Capnocytophaga sp. oral taxon 878 TaxID=1316596 RepID=UPI000D03867D|nr:hypothetical protein [Capnocytophaga sp. oral taxon 878]AVM50756.1 hypothetical protein C4H12_09900 [Capnocytophaga sp. oral taxon 878]